jgi:hypothetical protein
LGILLDSTGRPRCLLIDVPLSPSKVVTVSEALKVALVKGAEKCASEASIT